MRETQRAEREYINQLKSRFTSKNGVDTLRDDELLALLLSYTNAGKELERVMDGLYSRFGSFRSCFFATHSDLMRVDGMTHHAAMLIMLTARCNHLNPKPNFLGTRVTDYCELFLSVMEPSGKEQMWGAAFDGNDKLTAVEHIEMGSENSIAASIRNIAGFAVLSRSRRIVIAHSHPDMFEAVESRSDIETLSFIGRTLQAIGIELIGQVIVAGNDAKFTAFSPQ